MRLLSWIVAGVCLCGLALQTQGQPATSTNEFLSFIRTQAAALRDRDRPPTRLAEWKRQRAALRRQLLHAWGLFSDKPCPLNPRTLGELPRAGYRVEKIIFQTRPGVWMTANAYVPDGAGPHSRRPAVLCVHGHWKGAKQDPTVQARCIGLVKLGFFVLVVDAFGAGERGLGKDLGEYHGEMVAGTLWPVGLSLSGLQVYENMRAADYLCSRPEVEPTRLGITGASGGGNQTMYAGAWDERFRAVAPVCSVGNYQAYLGAACCLCEVVPGALRFTEEWGVLGLVAPRALLVVNATQDSRQFSVAEARKSLAYAQPVFDLLRRPEHLRHTTFESRHDYNQSMREAMYGWMMFHLMDRGTGSPTTEPEIRTEDPELLRCFPGQSRPDDFVTVPSFAAAEGRRLLAHQPSPTSFRRWERDARRLKDRLADHVLGGFPVRTPLNRQTTLAPDGRGRRITFQPEPGLTLTAGLESPASANASTAILLDLDSADKARENPLAAELRRAGWSVVTTELRATGRLAWPTDRIGRAPDHTTAEWSLWIGRPLLGQWVWDVRRLLDAIAEQEGALPPVVSLIGVGPAGVVALCTAALDSRVTRVATVNSLASFITEEPYEGQRLGVLAPGILSEVGDIAQLAALVAPRRVVIAGGVAGAGRTLNVAELAANYASLKRVFELAGPSKELIVTNGTGPPDILASLQP